MNNTILKLSNKDAKKYFLQDEAYCNFNLPPYISFENLLKALEQEITSVGYTKCLKHNREPKNYEYVNYPIYTNIDGKYHWRKLELIHPVLYVLLVNEITRSRNWKVVQDRFEQFSKNEYIVCTSIPALRIRNPTVKASQVKAYIDKVEQESVKISLKFNYVHRTDIKNFYPSIYTHSVDWSLRGKDIAKKNRFDKTLGPTIDKYLMGMNYGQTNGIPQGSILMDLVAEIVLGYADMLLEQKLKQEKVKKTQLRILRYRDDYRIYTKNEVLGEKVLKLLTETLIELGLRINTTKTYSTNNILMDAIKKDKLIWLKKYQGSYKSTKSLDKKIKILLISATYKSPSLYATPFGLFKPVATSTTSLSLTA
jgi:hypothetical protein